MFNNIALLYMFMLEQNKGSSSAQQLGGNNDGMCFSFSIGTYLLAKTDGYQLFT